jgi:hypothetical protein
MEDATKYLEGARFFEYGEEQSRGATPKYSTLVQSNLLRQSSLKYRIPGTRHIILEVNTSEAKHQVSAYLLLLLGPDYGTYERAHSSVGAGARS